MGRALQIVEAVGAAGPNGLTVKQIGRRCGIGVATVYHLVRTLAYHGYLWRRDEGPYVVGTEFAGRYRDLVGAYRGGDAVGEVLLRAARRTGYGHLVARFVAERVTITAVCPGRRSPLVEEFMPGLSPPAHATAFGKALMATLKPEDRLRYLKEQPAGMAAYTPRTLTSPEALEVDLARAAPRGLYVDRGEYRRTVFTMAVLATPAEAAPERRAALACVLPVVNLDQVVPLLSDYAQELAKLL